MASAPKKLKMICTHEFSCRIEVDDLAVKECPKTDGLSPGPIRSKKFCSKDFPAIKYYISFASLPEDNAKLGLHVSLKGSFKVSATFTCRQHRKTEEEKSGENDLEIYSTITKFFDPLYPINESIIIQVFGTITFETRNANPAFSLDPSCLRQLYNAEDKDVEIKAANTSIFAHKFILQYFSAKFRTELEAGTNVLTVVEYKSHIIESAIKSCYFWDIYPKDLSEHLTLFKFFQVYGMEIQKARMEQFLISKIKSTTVVEIMNAMDTTQHSVLSTACIKFLKDSIYQEYIPNIKKLKPQPAGMLHSSLFICNDLIKHHVNSVEDVEKNTSKTKDISDRSSIKSKSATPSKTSTPSKT